MSVPSETVKLAVSGTNVQFWPSPVYSMSHVQPAAPEQEACAPQPVPPQTPLVHMSLMVQGFPSLHATLLMPVCLQPPAKPLPASAQESAVHGSWSSQKSALPPLHTLLPQWSPSVHISPSLQVTSLGMCAQLLFTHASSVHRLLSLQSTPADGFWQPTPPRQESVVQVSLSSQLSAPPALQLPATQWSPSLQGSPSVHAKSLGVCRHAPFAQLSVVQALPSSQPAPLFTCRQPWKVLHKSSEHAIPSLQEVGAGGKPHTPALQVAGAVYPSLLHTPALHGEASAKLVWVQTPGPLQESWVQGLLSSQFVTICPTHVPPLHMSPLVHALPSLQVTVLKRKTQPNLPLQLASVQGLLSSQVMAVPVQLPLPHTSFTVQTLKSSHGALLLVKTQPLMTSQLSVVQGLLSLHWTGVPPQVVLPQWSALVQASPSLQLMVLGKLTHPPSAAQLSSVHTLPSLQSVAVPGKQTPVLQTSPTVHALLSLHAAVESVWLQPLARSQLSMVQVFPSSQVLGPPVPQTPPLQVSFSVQPSPSSQGVLSNGVCTQPAEATQLSVVQTLLSSQSLATCEQVPEALSHLSTVHALLSSQSVAPLQPASTSALIASASASTSAFTSTSTAASVAASFATSFATSPPASTSSVTSRASPPPAESSVAPSAPSAPVRSPPAASSVPRASSVPVGVVAVDPPQPDATSRIATSEPTT